MTKIWIAAAALLAAGAANASIIPTLTAGPTAIGAGLFEYGYSATLASDQALFSGNYFTLYDFDGFTGVGTVPAGWTASTALVGLTPPDVLPTDNAGIINVTFTYQGPTLNFDSDPANNVELTFAPFVLRSTFGNMSFDSFTARAIKNDGLARGTEVSTIGIYASPGGVPEPTSWALLIVGFAMVGVSMRRRSPSVAA